jgi:hypothetical protein
MAALLLLPATLSIRPVILTKSGHRPLLNPNGSPILLHTAQLVTAMLKANTHVSDLIFSPSAARRKSK